MLFYVLDECLQEDSKPTIDVNEIKEVTQSSPSATGVPDTGLSTVEPPIEEVKLEPLNENVKEPVAGAIIKVSCELSTPDV